MVSESEESSGSCGVAAMRWEMVCDDDNGDPIAKSKHGLSLIVTTTASQPLCKTENN
jgi:hypothetical protein